MDVIDTSDGYRYARGAFDGPIRPVIDWQVEMLEIRVKGSKSMKIVFFTKGQRGYTCLAHILEQWVLV